MGGWKYEWVSDLPQYVYEILVEEMNAQQSDTRDS